MEMFHQMILLVANRLQLVISVREMSKDGEQISIDEQQMVISLQQMSID